MHALTLETRVTPDHTLRLPDELPVNARIRIHIEQLSEEAANTPTPRTPLGQRLTQLRQAHLARGGKLLSPEELDAEVRQRRGGLADD
ncbi:hypothetical protein D5125_02340 [Magnetovirga frankeli]|uniref:hypothetical protein n=1 Tax=Magnetovirga frankeli TaxID=947516 RepID=UPI0012931734|nr:hypothetical protein D5125_02340 [gamma proteobacterium SS-5]